jgi:hypothetical protein
MQVAAQDHGEAACLLGQRGRNAGIQSCEAISLKVGGAAEGNGRKPGSSYAIGIFQRDADTLHIRHAFVARQATDKMYIRIHQGAGQVYAQGAVMIATDDNDL